MYTGKRKERGKRMPTKPKRTKRTQKELENPIENKRINRLLSTTIIFQTHIFLTSVSITLPPLETSTHPPIE